MQKLNALALGYTGATLSAIGMVIIWVFGYIGIYTKVVTHMQDWHMFFSQSFAGLIGGTIEAAVWSFLILWIFGWTYNKFTNNKE